MTAPKENPYKMIGNDKWWWRDEDAHAHGPYDTQMDALRAVLQHMDPTAQATARHDLKWNLVFLFTGAVITALAFWL